MVLLAGPASGEGELFHEHGGLVAVIDELAFPTEVELDADLRQ
jgi:hypothetical protein